MEGIQTFEFKIDSTVEGSGNVYTKKFKIEVGGCNLDKCFKCEDGNPLECQTCEASFEPVDGSCQRILPENCNVEGCKECSAFDPNVCEEFIEDENKTGHKRQLNS